jgi:hypothetical protein
MAAERRGIHEEAGAMPPAPHSDGAGTLAVAQQVHLTPELIPRPSVESERGQSLSLGHAREGDEAVPSRVFGHEREVNARREVGLSGVREQVVNEAVPPVAMDVAPGTSESAVVDHERVPALEGGGRVFDEAQSPLGYDGLLTEVESVRGGLHIVAGLDRDLHEPALTIDADTDLLGPVVGSADPTERQVVEQLVREDEVGAALETGIGPNAVDAFEHLARAGTAFNDAIVDRQTFERIQELSCERPVASPHLLDPEGPGSTQRVVELTDRAGQ